MQKFEQHIELERKFRTKTQSFLAKVKRPAKGALKHDYLVPGGPYEEQWDWDAFFMCGALASEKKSEAKYFKNWCLNYLEAADEDGRVAGCVTPEGADPRLHQVKPFIAQGAWLACTALGDSDWLAPHMTVLQSVVSFREKELWNKEYNLAVWHDSMESGADNNVALLDFPERSVAAADVNAFMYREFLALSKIAARVGNSVMQTEYAQKARGLKERMNSLLWSRDEQVYLNLDTRSGSQIRRVSYAAFVPLWAGIATEEQAAATIQRYLLNPGQLFAKAGARSLSKADPSYNNVNMIKPHSNWQGPVWPIANYIYAHGMARYGFVGEALELARRILQCTLSDLELQGGMHENYDADSAEPLAAPNFISWNLLLRGLVTEIIEKRDPFEIAE